MQRADLQGVAGGRGGLGWDGSQVFVEKPRGRRPGSPPEGAEMVKLGSRRRGNGGLLLDQV